MSLHLLIISDNPSFAEYLCNILSAAGYRPVSAPADHSAFHAIRCKNPGLIIVAVEPSRVVALAREYHVHSAEGSRKVPVIVISESLRLEAELMHVYDFIPKPLDVTRLLDDVKALSSEKGKQPPHPVLTERQYQEISAHILSCTGLHFELRNRPALERGLGKRMSALLISCFDDYLLYLKRHGEDRHELQKLLQFLTVGETYFFRYPAHFQALRERLQANAHRSAPIRIWSAGCSTGEEPYSIAIGIMEALPDWRSRDIRIYATDINNRSLKRAREGVYSPWSMRIAQEQHQKRYFSRVGDSYLIRDEVKELVEFHHLNLSAIDRSPLAAELAELDAVFCRNVLIYFSPDTAAVLVDSFAGMLKPSGQLFLGHAETLLHRCPHLQVRRQENSFYYVKTLQGSPVHQQPPPAAGVNDSSRVWLAGFSRPVETRQPLQEPLQPLQQPSQPLLSPETENPPAAAAPELPATPAAPPSFQAPLPSSSERLQVARRLFEAEEFDAAEQLLDGIDGGTEESEALVLRGFILAGKGLFREATVLCDRILAQNDLLAEAYFLKGVLLDATDQLAQAAEEYRKALLLDHDFIMPRYHMGRVHLRLGRPRDAAREIRNSIRILSKLDDGGTVPFSGGLTRSVCMMQLQNALAQVA